MKRNETKTGGDCPQCQSKATRTYATRNLKDPNNVRRHRECQSCGYRWYRIEKRQRRKPSARVQSRQQASYTIARWCAEILEHGHVLEGAQ